MQGAFPTSFIIVNFTGRISDGYVGPRLEQVGPGSGPPFSAVKCSLQIRKGDTHYLVGVFEIMADPSLTVLKETESQ